MSTWRFYLPDQQETAEDAHSLEYSSNPWHNENTAEQAAAQYYDVLSGWESDWPVGIVLVSPEGEESRWTVDMQMEPTFTAHEE